MVLLEVWSSKRHPLWPKGNKEVKEWMRGFLETKRQQNQKYGVSGCWTILPVMLGVEVISSGLPMAGNGLICRVVSILLVCIANHTGCEDGRRLGSGEELMYAIHLEEVILRIHSDEALNKTSKYNIGNGVHVLISRCWRLFSILLPCAEHEHAAGPFTALGAHQRVRERKSNVE